MFLRSKKTSESGVWINDEDVDNCYCCAVKFNFSIRKHHCRNCGQVVCGACSENTVFLESSRTGAPKRVCDTCFKKIREGGGSAAVDDDVSSAADKLAKASVAAKPPGGITPEDAARILKDHPFAGRWEITAAFEVCDVARCLPEGAAGGLDSFKTVSSGSRKSATTSAGAMIKPGSKVKLPVDLETKGAAYFRGTIPEFGQFGKDGKVTGAVQKMTAKVNMTIQVVSARGITTSFNFVGQMTKAGILSGSFSGCEISKAAGSASGVFTMKAVATSDGDGGGGGSSSGSDASPPPAKGAAASSPRKKAAGKAAAGSDSDDAPKKKPSKKSVAASDSDDAPKKKPAKKAAAGSDSDDAPKKKPAKKAAASSDSDDAPKKKPVKKAAAESSDSDPAPKKKPVKKAADSSDSDAAPPKKAAGGSGKGGSEDSKPKASVKRREEEEDDDED